jgi:hypothetical protein
MTLDATYIMQDGPAAARILQRTGRWDEALALLPRDAVAQRAETLVERGFWRLEGIEEALEAVGALRASDPVLAGFLEAQVRYTRHLFGLEPRPDDVQLARAGFEAARADSRLTGWATFWVGILADNVDGDVDAAAPAYREAREHAVERGDALLESYAVRHIGAHLLEVDRDRGIALLRRSYHLRAALGARPQTAAAAVTLAGELAPGDEADQLLEAAALTAQELGLTWLLRAL